jgi:hypothetical protein
VNEAGGWQYNDNDLGRALVALNMKTFCTWCVQQFTAEYGIWPAALMLCPLTSSCPAGLT